MDTTDITGIAMGNIYTNDYDKAYEFYVVTLGLGSTYQMGENSCYLKINDKSGIYIEGGYEKSTSDTHRSCSSFSLNVDSAAAMFGKLKKAGVELFHEAPLKMDENVYWFQCYDPVGNLLEFLGGK